MLFHLQYFIYSTFYLALTQINPLSLFDIAAIVIILDRHFFIEVKKKLEHV